jgi:prepilin-type N-terminal cleavage/methylation domain-containing protein
MISKLRKRIQRDEQGFTLIELLVVVVILGILTAIAVPSYLSFQGRSKDAAAKADLRVLLPSVESFYADNNTYVGMSFGDPATDPLSLLKYDQSIKPDDFAMGTLTATTYCVETDPTGQDKLNAWHVTGPGAVYATGACP